MADDAVRGAAHGRRSGPHHPGRRFRHGNGAVRRRHFGRESGLAGRIHQDVFPAVQGFQRARRRGASGIAPRGTAVPALGGEHSAGKTLYAAKGCATCHGEGGKGDGPVAAALVDSWGWPIRPWDFTQGYYKSGRTDRDLFRTITTGLNGTPMPGFGPATTVAERWQLVDYLASLANGRSGFWFALFRAEPTGIVYGSN